MKRALNLLFLLVVILGIMVVASFFLLGGPQTIRQRRHFDRLVKTNDHKAVALAAISVIRTNTEQMVFTQNRLTNLPPAICRMEPRYVSVSPDGMTMEFHGGFDHFGFKIEDRGENWEMSSYSEHGSHSLLSIGKGELNGAANESQPSRSKTNSTPSPPQSSSRTNSPI